MYLVYLQLLLKPLFIKVGYALSLEFKKDIWYPACA